MPTLYDTKPWRDYRSRVLSADAECAFARLAGGCRGALQVHHVDPLSEGGEAFPRENDGITVLCARHHGLLHAWRRKAEEDEKPKWKRCPHQHRTRESREQCERRLNAAA